MILEVSRRITSMCLESRFIKWAMVSANAEGLISRRLAVRPSALDTAFCVTTSMSPVSTATLFSWAALIKRRPRSSPLLMIGIPCRPMIVISLGSLRFATYRSYYYFYRNNLLSVLRIAERLPKHDKGTDHIAQQEPRICHIRGSSRGSST